MQPGARETVYGDDGEYSMRQRQREEIRLSLKSPASEPVMKVITISGEFSKGSRAAWRGLCNAEAARIVFVRFSLKQIS